MEKIAEYVGPNNEVLTLLVWKEPQSTGPNYSACDTGWMNLLQKERKKLWNTVAQNSDCDGYNMDKCLECLVYYQVSEDDSVLGFPFFLQDLFGPYHWA